MRWRWHRILLGLVAVVVGVVVLTDLFRPGMFSQIEIMENMTSRLRETGDPVMASYLAEAHVGAKQAVWGAESLSYPEYVVLSVVDLEREVSIGGFEEYYSSSWGDNAHDAAGALEAVGATREAAIVRRAVALFGTDGPSPDQKTRRMQMGLWTDEQRRELSQLKLQRHGMQDLVGKYVLEHVDDFQPRRTNR